MKIDRHLLSPTKKTIRRLLGIALVGSLLSLSAQGITQETPPPNPPATAAATSNAATTNAASTNAASEAPATSPASSDAAEALRMRREAAAWMIERAMLQLISGPAFDAKLTQQIRTQGRSAVGVGRYEQAGGNTGRVNMEMMVPTSNGKCLLQQMCDGRLAWTREQVGETVRLRRVDVGRLDEMVGAQAKGISPRLRVGGLVEMLERAHADYHLEQVPAELEGHPVWMLKGSIRPASEAAILRKAQREDWPPLCPKSIAIAIAAEDNESGFGKGLPVRFEFWSDGEAAERRLISYLKIYDLRTIQPASETHFRFETGESDVNYTNDTQRYLDHFGIHLTEKQQRLLTR